MTTIKTFAENAKAVLSLDDNVTGLAAGGSWISGQLDKFSDLDLVVVTNNRISGDTSAMLAIAGKLGNLLCGFTGEHVGEPRLLICLYDNPLLHVDLKFLIPDELMIRVEDPVILLDKENLLSNIIQQTKPHFPLPDFQWIEDRFWIWIHYVLQKIGRGELLEAFDFFGFIRLTVLGPLLQLGSGNTPRGVRKLEAELEEADVTELLTTLPEYNKLSLLTCVKNTVQLYRQLRTDVYGTDITLQNATEEKVMAYFTEIQDMVQ